MCALLPFAVGPYCPGGGAWGESHLSAGASESLLQTDGRRYSGAHTPQTTVGEEPLSVYQRDLTIIYPSLWRSPKDSAGLAGNYV